MITTDVFSSNSSGTVIKTLSGLPAHSLKIKLPFRFSSRDFFIRVGLEINGSYGRQRKKKMREGRPRVSMIMIKQLNFLMICIGNLVFLVYGDITYRVCE